ncbi:MAG: hypothetical protein IPK20_00455 [Betaproteobacteria bacterium]|nr:hypothetical protein [Betaproteobacteria bacterium]
MSWRTAAIVGFVLGCLQSGIVGAGEVQRVAVLDLGNDADLKAKDVTYLTEVLREVAAEMLPHPQYFSS